MENTTVSRSNTRLNPRLGPAWITAGVAVLLSLLATVEFIEFKDWDFDDSYIVYRLCQNLIEGNGWSFNPGEIHNASTSVLNPLLIAAAGTVIPSIPIAAHLLGSLWIFIAGLAVHCFLVYRFGVALSIMAGTLVTILLGHNHTWGLESHLFAALFAIFLLQEDRSKNSWPVLGLLVLARPDGLLLVALKWFHEYSRSKSKSVRGLVQVAAVVAPWAIFSLWKFREVFPATLEQKIWQGASGYWGRGRFIFLEGLRNHLFGVDPVDPIHWILALLALPGAYWIIRERHPLSFLVLFSGIQQAIYTVLNVPAYHWYFSLLDLTLLLAALFAIGPALEWAGRYFGKAGSRIRWVLASAAVLSCGHLLALHGLDAWSSPKSDFRDQGTRHVAREILRRAPRDRTLAAVEVGVVGFGTRRTIVDMTGLTSPNPEYISGGNSDQFFASPPDAVLIHQRVWNHERSLYDDIRFKLMYRLFFLSSYKDFQMAYYERIRRVDQITPEEQVDYIRSNFQGFKRSRRKGVLPEDPDRVVCNFDAINGRIAESGILKVHQPMITATGWAFVRGERTLGRVKFSLTRDGDNYPTYTARARRKRRSDVARRHKSQNYVRSGFEFKRSLLDIPEGTYQVGVIQKSKSGPVMCTRGLRLVVGG